ncbi:MAG TPA: hypothetical protein VIK29_09610, partial [Paludibacter sp.]
MQSTCSFSFFQIVLLGFILTSVIACKTDEPNTKNPINTGIVTDIEGNVYQTVTIGTQVWMSENLKSIHYRNGDTIANVIVDSIWAGLST